MTPKKVEEWFSTAASGAQEYGARKGIRFGSPKSLGRWVYILAITFAAVWTLVMWGVYALLGSSDEALSAAGRLFAVDAQSLEWLTSLVGGMQ